MNSKRPNKEETKKYEEEFSEFLIQKIQFFGGSSKIQQLSACLRHARFELRDAFGTTNSDLMKFLRAHRKIFLVDSKGTISISASGDDSDDLDNTTKSTEIAKSFSSKIENGSGIVVKSHPEFGIIKATEPEEAYVHFKQQAFSGNADTLFVDCRPEVGEEVYFNAYPGHEMFDFKYRASKVWRTFDKNEDPGESYKENVVPDNLEGEGVIQKLFSNLGFILVAGKKNETVFFHRSTVRDCSNVELTQFFNVGDLVEFSASRSDKKDSKAQWQARVVKKKAKRNDVVPSSSHTETKVSVAAVKNDAVKDRLEDEPGRISPYAHGAVIKFGKNYSERAAGDSSKYFLYGAEVSDIHWEFSEDDDVYFDAIKIKSLPGWKAILVWAGDKPSWINIDKLFADEELKELSEEKSCASSSNISTASYSPSLRSKGTKSQREAPFMTERVTQNRNKPLERSITEKGTQSDRDYAKRNSKSSKDPHIFPTSKSKNTNWWDELRDKNSSASKSRGNRYRRAKGLDRGLDKISSRDEEDYMADLSCKNDISAISEDGFQGDKSQGILQERRNGVKKKYGRLARASNYNFPSSDENDSDDAGNEIQRDKSADSSKASIKKFEDIDGEIINLYCKMAIIRSSHLQTEVSFVLNAFYLNGKPAEEHEVNDLKEILKVGDNVKFNCFEIIDDSGKIHQRVTTAWKGCKPDVYEMSPEEFIKELDLSVTISDERVSQCIPQNETKNLTKEGYRGFARASRYDLSDESDSDDACNEMKRYKSADNRKPSIKKFEDIDGEIVNLYCKMAIIRSSHLQEKIDFVLNSFYLNGKPAEDQEVNDLKEIFKVGDNVKFNCFEIIDDSGKIHQRVTTAWKGSKPDVYEITPEDFIEEHGLSVTLSDEVVPKCIPQNKTKNLAKERYRGSARASRYDLSDENNVDNARNEVKRHKSADNRTPSIKKFDDIDGEIVNLYCKIAIIKSSRLQKEIDFLINVFYLNGKSAEEEQVIDLKEIFKVGDNVKFNCFEIIDDSGELHGKVTLAWKGPKPKVNEITPEEFIKEHGLAVTRS